MGNKTFVEMGQGQV